MKRGLEGHSTEKRQLAKESLWIDEMHKSAAALELGGGQG